jgi:hypothetical protein
VLSMWPRKNIFHIQVLVIYFFPTPPGTDKIKIGIAVPHTEGWWRCS